MPASDSGLGRSSDHDLSSAPESTALLIWRELCQIVRLAVPVTCSLVLYFGLGVVNVLMVGHLGVESLAGAALGSVSANVTGIATIRGVLGALDTLASQAYGARNHRLVGCLAQRAALIAVALCVPVVLLWYNIAPVLIAMGQNPAVARLAATYLRWSACGLAPNMLFEVARKYLLAQSIVSPVAWIVLVAVIWDVAATYVLMWPLGLGFIGSPIAGATTYLLMFVLTVLYIRFGRQCLGQHCPSRDPLRCWGGFSSEALRGWGAFLVLGLPSCAMLCAEWWAYELITLAAGLLGTKELAASNITQQLLILSFMFPLAVSLAVSTRIGNHLGATASCAARRCCRIALLLNEGVGVAISLLWLLLRRAWAAAFTADATVIECTAELVALMAVFQLFDVLSCTMSCALRGAGLQAQGAALMLAGQWGLGVPLGLGLGFRVRLGLLGLWAGLGLGTVATVALEGVLLAGLDWDALAARACTRVMGEGEGRAEVPLRDGVGVEGGLKGGEGGQAPGYRTF